MERRKFVIGLGALTSGSAAAVGTGAFQATGTRQQGGLNAQVEGGANANLGINPNTSNDFVSGSGRSDELSIDFTAENGGGLNINGVTEVRPAFSLTNNFSEPFFVEIYNPLRNPDISSSEENRATTSQGSGSNSGGSNNRVEVPAGLDVQFIGATDGVLTNGSPEGDVALIDRADGPSSYDFQDPEDPSTIQVNIDESTPAGGQIDYLSFGDDDSGYLKLGAGEAVNILVRAVVNSRFLPTTDPSALDNRLDSEFTIRAYNNADAMVATDDAVLGADVP